MHSFITCVFKQALTLKIFVVDIQFHALLCYAAAYVPQGVLVFGPLVIGALSFVGGMALKNGECAQ